MYDRSRNLEVKVKVKVKVKEANLNHDDKTSLLYKNNKHYTLAQNSSKVENF